MDARHALHDMVGARLHLFGGINGGKGRIVEQRLPDMQIDLRLFGKPFGEMSNYK